MPRIPRFTTSPKLFAALLPALLLGSAAAQTAPAAPQEKTAEPKSQFSRPSRNYDLDPVKVFRLSVGAEPNYENEILTGLRLILNPSVKLYLIPSTNTMVVRGTPEDLALAQQLLDDTDKPKTAYKLTYTIVESDSGKRLGVQHFTLAMISGARTTLKSGSKVPVATGSYSTSGASAQTQFTYLDVGLNFDATLDEGSNGVRLRSKVEQSSATEDKTIAGVQEPVVRQAVLDDSLILVPGKSVTLGALDVAGSTRHLDIEVLLEVAK